MDIGVFQQYVELARTLNFSHAANNLNITQPTLSRTIAQMEKQLGVRLFNRKRELTITDAGKTVLEHAYNILQEQQTMLARLEAIRKNERNTLIVEDAALFPRLAGIIRETLTCMMEEDLEIETVRHSVHGETLFDALFAGHIDVGFYFCMGSDCEPLIRNKDRLAWLELKPYENVMYLAIPKTHPLAQKNSLKASDLTQIKIVKAVDARLEECFEPFTTACKQRNITLRYHMTTANNFEEILRLHRDDCGGLISDSVLAAGLIPLSTSERLKFVLLEDLDTHFYPIAIWRKDGKSATIEHFLHKLTAAMSSPRNESVALSVQVI